MQASKVFNRNITTLSLLIAISAAPASAVFAETQSDEIVVTAPSSRDAVKPSASQRLKSSDTASLLAEEPGVSLQTGGGVSSLPVINGLGDDRIQISIDNLIICSACANHMNPPLSYIPASSVGYVTVHAGVTPVSIGGDSIGGTIQVESEPPLFAVAGQGLAHAGTLSTYYRSNNRARGVSLASSIASSKLSFGITASHDRAGDYRDGHGDRVTSTYYESNNLGMTLAAKTDSGVVTLKAGHQSIPEEGFVNQWMDMIDNDASYANIGYKAGYGWGKLDAKAYWQNTWHKMDSGKEKLEFPLRMPHMPMETRGINIGYALKTDINLADESVLRLGNEFHRFTLDDQWPPVTGSTTMAPNTFLNINHGRRDRYVLFAEWEAKPTERLTTIIGVRNEQVRMNTEDVHGYSDSNGSMMMPTNYKRDSDAFNALDHSRSDSNWDFTVLAKLEPSSSTTWELGYSRKTRSPNLYERYAWSTMWMTSGMIGWFGDGNGYVGNPDLKPEIAHTVSLTAGWHDSDRSVFELEVTPYYTYVNDYIGVEDIGNSSAGTRNILRFVNHDAELYGIDISGKVELWENDGFGTGQLKGRVGYVHGKNQDTGSSLYHMMPLNLGLTLEQKIAGWTNAIELQLVDEKSKVDTLRYEPETSGYALLNLRTAYQYKGMRVDLAVMNLFDRFYFMPMGGVNYDQSLA
ncbi:MAG: TonB-dependent receptor, partial [Chlorobiaceae bacterium]|nr:TonB-dependent receptor [Chlorobiaceae bacterium]